MWMRSLAAVYEHDAPAGVVQVSAHMQRLGLVAACVSCTCIDCVRDIFQWLSQAGVTRGC